MLFSCIASKGIGVHMLKAGSKRRRTQADMKTQEEMEQLVEIESRDREI